MQDFTDSQGLVLQDERSFADEMEVTAAHSCEFLQYYLTLHSTLRMVKNGQGGKLCYVFFTTFFKSQKQITQWAHEQGREDIIDTSTAPVYMIAVQ